MSVSGEVLDDGEPDVADLGCVFGVEAVIGRFGPLRWVGLDPDGDVPVVADVDVPPEDVVADAASSAAATPCPVATAVTSHADTAMPPYRPARAVVLTLRDIR